MLASLQAKLQIVLLRKEAHLMGAHLERIESITNVDDFLGKESDFKSRFLELDHASIVEYLLKSFSDINAGYHDWGPLPMGHELIDEMLKRGPTADGIFRNDYDEEYTKDELDEMKDNGMQALGMIDNGEAPFHELFKYCDVLSWELNPGDY